MLPDTEYYDPEEETEEDLLEESIPEKTYRLNFETKTIGGYFDDMEARKQAIMKILLTEYGVYQIYSEEDYGRIYEDLIGKPMTYAVSEVKARIREAILTDERFETVDFTEQKINGRKAAFDIVVTCADGESLSMEGVELNV